MGAFKSKAKVYAAIAEEEAPKKRGRGICKQEGCSSRSKYKDTGYCYPHACKHDATLMAERIRKSRETRAKVTPEQKQAKKDAKRRQYEEWRARRREKHRDYPRSQGHTDTGISFVTAVGTAALAGHAIGGLVRAFQ